MDKNFDFETIGKRTPFRTPEGFFERMQAETLKRVAEEKRKKKIYRLKWGISAALAIAAMVCGFIFFPMGETKTDVPMDANAWIVQAMDETDEMDLYLQSLSDEELEDWIEFSENDIFYELTTENLNEDED